MLQSKNWKQYINSGITYLEVQWHKATRANSWLETVLVILLALIMACAFAALVLFFICLGPLILIWAINTIAPVFGSTLVIPYSIPLMIAIAVVLAVVRSIFRRTVKIKVR